MNEEQMKTLSEAVEERLTEMNDNNMMRARFAAYAQCVCSCTRFDTEALKWKCDHSRAISLYHKILNGFDHEEESLYEQDEFDPEDDNDSSKNEELECFRPD